MAATRVFNITELVEQILKLLPMHSLLHMQKLNKKCKSIINTNQAYQQTLYFSPEPVSQELIFYPSWSFNEYGKAQYWPRPPGPPPPKLNPLLARKIGQEQGKVLLKIDEIKGEHNSIDMYITQPPVSELNLRLPDSFMPGKPRYLGPVTAMDGVKLQHMMSTLHRTSETFRRQGRVVDEHVHIELIFQEEIQGIQEERVGVEDQPDLDRWYAVALGFSTS